MNIPNLSILVQIQEHSFYTQSIERNVFLHQLFSVIVNYNKYTRMIEMMLEMKRNTTEIEIVPKRNISEGSLGIFDSNKPRIEHYEHRIVEDGKIKTSIQNTDKTS